VAPEEEARQLAKKYGTCDPERIAREMGILVTCADMTHILGVALSMPTCRVAVVTTRLPGWAQRFVLAHELGHFVLHPTGNFLFVLTHTLFYTRWEYQANLFAAALLLGPEFRQHRTMLKELAATRVDKLLQTFEGYGAYE